MIYSPELLAHLAGRNDNRVELQESGGLLGTRIKNGYWPFNIAEPDDHRDCPDTPPTGTALELLESTGGFLTSASGHQGVLASARAVRLS